MTTAPINELYCGHCDAVIPLHVFSDGTAHLPRLVTAHDGRYEVYHHVTGELLHSCVADETGCAVYDTPYAQRNSSTRIAGNRLHVTNEYGAPVTDETITDLVQRHADDRRFDGGAV